MIKFTLQNSVRVVILSAILILRFRFLVALIIKINKLVFSYLMILKILMILVILLENALSILQSLKLIKKLLILNQLK